MNTSVFQTLAYFDLFDFPLTLDELEKYLWRGHLTQQEIIYILAHTNKIEGKEGLMFLKDNSRLVNERKKKRVHAKKLWKKTKRYVELLRMIPFIKMVGVCNNLAFNNPDIESDIDLFIIIKKRRIWLTRLMITGLFHILGVRRHGNKIKGRFCLSFFSHRRSMEYEKNCITSI